MPIDTYIFYLLNNLVFRSPAFDGVIMFFASYLAYIVVGAFIMLLIVSRQSWRSKAELFAVAFVSVVIARFGITEIIRFFYHRPRPFMEIPTNSLFMNYEWSFPSGHATFFFALSTAVYIYNKAWGSVFFVASTLMVLSRVAAGVHYPSDILAGAAIGIVVAYGLHRLVRRFFPVEKTRVDESTEVPVAAPTV